MERGALGSVVAPEDARFGSQPDAAGGVFTEHVDAAGISGPDTGVGHHQTGEAPSPRIELVEASIGRDPHGAAVRLQDVAHPGGRQAFLDVVVGEDLPVEVGEPFHRADPEVSSHAGPDPKDLIAREAVRDRVDLDGKALRPDQRPRQEKRPREHA